MGHAVGDELILGATSCMKNCFGGYGNLYRVGGDEFMAVIAANEETLKFILKDFEAIVSKWHGEHLDSIAIAYGYVLRMECKEASLEEMEQLADRRMYENKKKYYETYVK